jgi:DNA polymerase I
VILVQTEEQFNAALDLLKQASHIAFDTETWGKRGTPVKHPAQGNRLIGLSAHCVLPMQGMTDRYEIGFYFPFRHEHDDKVLNLFTVSENLDVELLSKMAEVLNRDDLRQTYHHMKFDLQMMRADNLILSPKPGQVTCTMAKAQLVDENMSHKLEEVAALCFPDEDVKSEEEKIKTIIKKQGGYHKTTPQQMAPYACQDAKSAFRIEPFLDHSLEQQGLTHLVQREMEFQICLMEMEWEGILLDADLARALSRKAQRRMHEIEDELGFDPSSKFEVARVLFGPPNAGGLMLPYEERTIPTNSIFPQGVPATGQKILAQLRHPIAERALEYRGIQKADSTWYRGWLDRMGTDGRIHPTYNVSEKKEKFGTVTSRLSSFIQQIPRNPKAMVKLLLMPGPGMIMVEFDYNQIEYRLGVCYAEDKDLIEQFRSGADVHQEFADAIGVDRQTAKPTTYCILFGGQGPAVARSLELQAWINERRVIHIEDSYGQALVNEYYNLHPKMRQIAYAAKKHAETYGYVQLWNGRRRHFHGQWKFAARKAFNSILQGGAAQIVTESMLGFHNMRASVPYRMRFQVHDSLGMEMPEANMDAYCHEIQTMMEWPSKRFAVPFPVDMKITRRHELSNIDLEGVSDELLGVGSRGDDGMGEL